MNDRELLEGAAKAAGIDALYDEQWGGMLLPVQVQQPSDGLAFWNPLTDDGDALRLAMHLSMSLSTGPCRASANTISGALRGAFFTEDTIAQPQDEAVRRVIVHAAAEYGMNMQ